MKFSAIRHADLSWNEQGTPVSQFFDDVYFSNHNGLQETRYVFIGGNHLYQRFPHHQTDLFTVAETGFGIGLNFLTLWQCFNASRQQNSTQKLQRLHMISCEQYPLTAADLAQAHLPWPELAPFATALQQQWPDAIPGCHRLLFDEGRITLDLWLGEINQLIDDFDDSLQGQVDAWFLDGFAPARNPDMWTDKLFRAMARFSKSQATFATFTAAGFVRRGLQRAGFQVTRRKGFGHKREMLTGHLPDTFAAPSPAPWYSRPAASSRNIAIIGGGIASACLALALLRRNYQVTLYCADAQAAGNASGNRQGALYPLLNPYDPNLASFFPAAFAFARRFYDNVPVVYEHDWCGVLQLGWDEKSQKKIDRMLKMSLPESLACAVSRDNTTALAGLAVDHGGIFYPQGGWLSPVELTTALWSLASERGAVCYWRHEVSDLQSTEPGWQLTFSDGTQTQHPELVLAAGHQINRFAASHPLPVYPAAGQVSHMASDPPLTSLRTVLCYDGYLTPVSPGQQTHCLGASYHRGSDDLNFSEYDQQMNLQRLQGCLPASEWTRSIDLQAGDARRGVRCATRDHLPMAGAVPNYSQTLEQYAQLQSRSSAPATIPPAPVWPGLYVLGALGSRGLCSAPLAAEVLAAQLCGEPQPLDRHTLNALQPSRFWIRKLLKGRAVKSPPP